MNLSPFRVRATAGSLRSPSTVDGCVLQHSWTEEGVVAGPSTNGAQLLHLSIALCILNDTYREAARLGIQVDGVSVEVDGGFDDDWHSTGVAYSCTVDASATAEDVAHLQAVVDEVAEIPRVVRAGAPVRRAAPDGVDGGEHLAQSFDGPTDGGP